MVFAAGFAVFDDLAVLADLVDLVDLTDFAVLDDLAVFGAGFAAGLAAVLAAVFGAGFVVVAAMAVPVRRNAAAIADASSFFKMKSSSHSKVWDIARL